MPTRPMCDLPGQQMAWLAAMRRRLEEEIRKDVAAACAARRAGRPAADLRPSAIDGFMDDRDDNDLNDEEGSWR
jgi:hypothetical protein